LTDFFVSGIKPASEVVPQERVMADVIPEGFFDNPKQDAKVSSIVRTIQNISLVVNIKKKYNSHQILIYFSWYLLSLHLSYY
jgi:hypothetical protein